MNIKVNGKMVAVDPYCSIREFLTSRGMEGSSIVIDLNGRIIKGQDWEETVLREGDVLEILRLVGGG